MALTFVRGLYEIIQDGITRCNLMTCKYTNYGNGVEVDGRYVLEVELGCVGGAQSGARGWLVALNLSELNIFNTQHHHAYISIIIAR